MSRHTSLRALPKVAIVGPVPPFRSGIARHTEALARALDRRADLRVFSFKRQYPAWLFPGPSDREPGAGPPDGRNVAYLLDCLDPLTWRRALKALLDFRPDVVLIPWWTVFWAPAFWYLARGCRRRGLTVELLCHNVLDHETAWWKTWLTLPVLRQASTFLVHSRSEAARLAALVPGAQIRVHPHPLYDGYPDPAGRLPRRAELELLFFGLVRPYKGLDVLIEAMGLLGPASVRLSIVGEFWQPRDAIERRICALGLAERIEIVPHYVSDQEAAEYFARADAVVLPYLSATASGVVALAYHYGKPVIASRVGGLSELVSDGETGVLVPAGSAPQLAEAIASFTARRAAEMRPAIRAFTRDMSWDSLASCVLDQSAPTATAPQAAPGEPAQQHGMA